MYGFAVNFPSGVFPYNFPTSILKPFMRLKFLFLPKLTLFYNSFSSLNKLHRENKQIFSTPHLYCVEILQFVNTETTMDLRFEVGINLRWLLLF